MSTESSPLTRAEISRINGAKSRGPVTVEGKAASSQNAVKHGFRASAMVLLPSESAEEFGQFYESFYNSYLPEDALQLNLLERVVNCAWRLRRVGMLESSIFRDAMAHRETFSQPFYSRGTPTALSTLNRYEASLENSMFKALKTLLSLQAAKGAREGRKSGS